MQVIGKHDDGIDVERHPAPCFSKSMTQVATMIGVGEPRALLTFSSKTSVEKVPVDLRAVITKATRLLDHVLPDSIEIVTDAPDAVPVMVNGDDSQLQQVVMNLAINARDALPEGGTLRIAVSIDGDRARTRRVVRRPTSVYRSATPDLECRPTFATALSNHSSRPNRRERETGLGLSIIHGIVKDHQGSIQVQSEVGAGTTFRVLLPEASLESVRMTAESMRTVPRGSGELILLAEDNRHVRGILATTLESLNYRVIQVADGGELMSAFELHGSNIRLFVLDVDLPVRDGLRCLQNIRAAGSKTPAIVITGNIGSSLNHELDEHSTLMRKPFKTTDFGVRIGRLLTAKHSAEGRS